MVSHPQEFHDESLEGAGDCLPPAGLNSLWCNIAPAVQATSWLVVLCLAVKKNQGRNHN